MFGLGWLWQGSVNGMERVQYRSDAVKARVQGGISQCDFASGNLRQAPLEGG